MNGLCICLSRKNHGNSTRCRRLNLFADGQRADGTPLAVCSAGNLAGVAVHTRDKPPVHIDRSGSGKRSIGSTRRPVTLVSVCVASAGRSETNPQRLVDGHPCFLTAAWNDGVIEDVALLLHFGPVSNDHLF